MTLIFALMLLLFSTSENAARSVENSEDSPIAVLSGTLYAVEPLSGQSQYRINHGHLAALNNSSFQTMRLHLGNEHAAIDMELSQNSVWTEDSQVIERRGEEVKELPNVIDNKCFLSGRLKSHTGAVSLHRCGKLTGLIHAGDYHYELEHGDNTGLDSELSNIKVTMRKSQDIKQEDSFVINDDVIELGNVDKKPDERLFKRQADSITAEVAVFLDEGFINYHGRRGKTTADLTQWMIQKWNIIKSVYGNVARVGIPFSIQLKAVELFIQNPYYYNPYQSTNDDQVFFQFCPASPDNPNYDHKMLYTQGTGGSHMGVSPLSGICKPTYKCSLVKSQTNSVKIELHEFGHNIGFKHDPDIQPPCADRSGYGGFMGWGQNYDFMDCYRRVLLRSIRLPSYQCLFDQNVYRPILNRGRK